jgi:hypothetical protein
MQPNPDNAPGRIATLCKYSVTEERLHDPGEIPYYNESAYLNFVSTEPGFVLGGVARVGLRPNQGYAEFFIMLPLADGTTLYWSGRQPADRAGFAVDSGTWRTSSLTMEVAEAGREWRISYADPMTRRVMEPSALGSLGQALKASQPVDCSAALTFTGTHPLHVMQESGDMIPGEDAARDHYEQFGVVSGVVQVAGDNYELRSARAFRDHSWGPRNYVSAMANQDWFTVQFDDGENFVGYRIRSRPDLPVQGARVDARGVAYLSDVVVTTSWAGHGALQSPAAIEVQLPGERIAMTASVDRAVMVKHRSPGGVARNTFGLMHVTAGSRVGGGWIDLSRPGLENER